ncbi:hypothetical protein SAMN05414139_10432 [Burkholderia sp. D7]|nr:hypothetical protein SAMN05414139_10432 [Burkholderia sp. D7]
MLMVFLIDNARLVRRPFATLICAGQNDDRAIGKREARKSGVSC